MTPGRFAAIVDAYGANSLRWPDAERAAAQAYERAHPDHVNHILQQAGSLDAVLESWEVGGPGSVLSARVLDGTRHANRSFHALRLWLSGAAAAVSLAGGVATGIGMVTQHSAPTASSLYATSIFGTFAELSDAPERDEDPR